MKRKLFATLLCLLMMATLLPIGSMAAVEYTGENLLKNGGFETTQAKDAAQPSNWNTLVIDGQAEKGTDYMLISGEEDGETVQPYSGDYAYKMIGKNSYDVETSKYSRIYIYQTLPELEVGKHYVLSGYINITEASGARVFIGQGTGYGGTATGGAMAYTGEDLTTNGWKKFSFLLSPTEETGVQFTVSCVLNNKGTVYLDDLSFYEKKNDTILAESGELEALHNDGAFSAPAAAYFDGYTKEGTNYDYVAENGQIMIKMRGLASSSGIKAMYPYYNKRLFVKENGNYVSTPVSVGDIVKLKFDAKLVSENTDLAGSYTCTVVHNAGQMYGSISIPSDALNKWVTVEYWFEISQYEQDGSTKMFTNLSESGFSVGVRQPLPGEAGKATADLLIDNFELYVDDGSYIGAGKTISTASGIKEVKDTTDTSLVIASASWNSRVSINEAYSSDEPIQPFVYYTNASEAETAVNAFSAIYEKPENGPKRLVAMANVPKTVATGASTSTTIPLSLENLELDADKTYCVETFLWNGSSIKPIVGKTEVSLTVADAIQETPEN